MNKKDNSKLLNYTTEIEPIKTAGEIMGLLAAKGAQAIMIDYDKGEPVDLSFKIRINGQEVYFKLPCNVDGAFQAMKRMRIPPRYVSTDQAKRTAWRIVKNWIEAQLAIVDCGQAQMGEVFLPYALTANGQALFQRIQTNPGRLLEAGEPEIEGKIFEGRFGN
jgi:hypothetical protein